MPKGISFDPWPDESFGKFDGTTVDDEYVEEWLDDLDPTPSFDFPGFDDELDFVDTVPERGLDSADTFFEPVRSAVGDPDLGFDVHESDRPTRFAAPFGSPVAGAPVPDAPGGNPIPPGRPLPFVPEEPRVLIPGADGVYRVMERVPDEPVRPALPASPYAQLPVSASFSIKEACGCSSCACRK